jgi:Cysteine rich repeat
MKGMKDNWMVLTVAVFFMSLWFGADVRAQMGNACADDIAKFCKGVQHGGGRISKCLKDHERELSPTCKEAVAAVQKRWSETAESCHDDVLKFCKDVEPGGGRVANCLRDHQSELSADCREKWLRQRKK